MLISKVFPSCVLEIKKKIMFWAQQSHINFNVHKHGQALAIIARENSDILPWHPWFPRKMMSEKQHRNSILMTRHYSDLGSASDWLKQISHAAQPIRSTTQIWGEMRHQYGISALVSQTSFRGQTRGAGPAERIFKWGANAIALAWANYGGSAGMLPWENLKLQSSEMARNGSKTAKSEVNF